MAQHQADRMTKAWRLALLAPLALFTAAAAGDSVPQVILATPGSEAAGDAAINRFTLRFSEAMVPLGDPRAKAPADHDCPVPGTGRWVDPQTWVLEFDRAIPAGNACEVTLKEQLLTMRGAAITGSRSFPIDTGGPSVRAVLAGGLVRRDRRGPDFPDRDQRRRRPCLGQPLWLLRGRRHRRENPARSAARRDRRRNPDRPWQ